jgi:hypothetical protein
MDEPGLWLTFLDEGDGRPAPRLRTGADPGAPEILLTDRARWVLGAIALPRELTPEDASDERRRARLGSSLWSSGEITDRIPYQHRSTIRHALNDLRLRLDAHGLRLEDHLLIDTARGRYALRGGRIVVDLLDLHELLDDPDGFDRRLDAAVPERGAARLAPIGAHLLADPAHRALDTAIQASAARARRAAASPATPPADGPSTPAPVDPGRNAAGPGPGESAHAPGRSTPRRRVGLAVGALAAILAGVIALVLVLQGGGGSQAAIRAGRPPRIEVSGGLAHTWSDPLTAGGRHGPEIFPRERVRIACRVRGFIVADGNAWWYLIDQRPWSRHFFVTADAFYNNGATHGSLRGSAFVDRAVARCSSPPRSAG